MRSKAGIKSPGNPGLNDDSRAIMALREMIHSASGIHLTEQKTALIRARLQKPMRLLGIDTLGDYVEFLKRDKAGAEWTNLLDAISTNVTSFYRESHHFTTLREFLVARLSQGARKLRIWSAGCSSGEEPYTIAIEALESIGSTRVDLKILATDISTPSMNACLRGEYAEKIVGSIPARLKSKYFSTVKRDATSLYSVSPALRSRVVVRKFNLTHFPYPFQASLDAIFCRNVMIYFEREMRDKIISQYHRALTPRGLLFIGSSESISGFADKLERVGTSVYRKR